MEHMSGCEETVVGCVTREKIDWQEQILTISKTRTLIVTFVNPYSFYIARNNKNYIERLSQFDIVLPDGMLMSKAVSIAVSRKVKRVSFDGNSLAPKIFDICRSNNLAVYLVGCKEGIINAVADRLRSEGLNIIGFRNGYFSSEAEMQESCERINESAPDIVICGMGAPMQEKYLVNLKNTGWKGAGFTCGGYLDQIVERDRLAYYPDWVNKYHLRAPYRMCKEPRRLIPRYTYMYMPFYRWYLQMLLNK